MTQIPRCDAMNPIESTIVKWKVKSLVKEAKVGKLGNVGRAVWAFLDGKKTLIWALVVALEKAFPDWPVWNLAHVVFGALGWSSLTPAIDPDQLVLWGTLAVALGHKAVKAWKETPVEEVKWQTIGTVPEVKPLPVAVLPAADPAPVTHSFEFLELRTKVGVPVGAEVTVPDGRRGIVFAIKEQTASGITYSVRVSK